MKKMFFAIIIIALLFIAENYHTTLLESMDLQAQDTIEESNEARNLMYNEQGAYIFPDLYRGIYLTVTTGQDKEKLQKFITRAKEAHINTFVIDVLKSKSSVCEIPAENVELCQQNGIHVIARIVVFPAGLNTYPADDKIKAMMERKIAIAVDSCKKGFHEIQLDYIRFNDSTKLKYVTLEKKYSFIDSVITGFRTSLKDYDVKIAADIFGRIPWNKKDLIGQNMERLDKVVDIICPMAYPSHYVEHSLQADPYKTVHLTSQKAKKRALKAEIVTYIQAFQMKISKSKLTYAKYIEEQIRAIHDAEVKGFIMWNARQDYDVPFEVSKEFYTEYFKKASEISAAE